MDLAQIFNFQSVDDKVDTSGLVNEDQLAELASAGYEAVINLLPDELDYAIGNEREILESRGIEYTYIPVDFSAPSGTDYEAFAQAMQGSKGKKLLVHCAANYRVSAFYAIYAHTHLGWDKQRCYEHIASIWDLAEHPRWQSFVQERINP